MCPLQTKYCQTCKHIVISFTNHTIEKQQHCFCEFSLIIANSNLVNLNNNSDFMNSQIWISVIFTEEKMLSRFQSIANQQQLNTFLLFALFFDNSNISQSKPTWYKMGYFFLLQLNTGLTIICYLHDIKVAWNTVNTPILHISTQKSTYFS